MSVQLSQVRGPAKSKPFCLVLALSTSVFWLIPFLQSVGQAPKYRIIDRGPILVRTLTDTPGFNNIGALAIWQTSDGSLAPGAVISKASNTLVFGEGSHTIVFPSDINEHSAVVGSLQVPQDLRMTEAFYWKNGSLVSLRGLGGSYSTATSINSSNVVVGSASRSDGVRHAVRWTKQVPQDLGLIDHGDFSSAQDINNKGTIVGSANLEAKGRPHAVTWSRGVSEVLPNLPNGTFCSAQAINDSEEIVGTCDGAGGVAHAVLWKARSPSELGGPAEDDLTSMALDINKHGAVVGTVEISDGKQRAYLWKDGKTIDLNTAIEGPSPWLLLVASRINDNGDIVGRGFLQGSIHEFMLQAIRTVQ